MTSDTRAGYPQQKDATVIVPAVHGDICASHPPGSCRHHTPEPGPLSELIM